MELAEKNRIQDFDSLLTHLKRALRSDGDFPARARTVSNLISLANNPNTPVYKISKVLLTEASLGARVLYTVNSVYFQGARPVVTVTEAVVRIGMRNLCDLFAGLVLMQGFIPLARRGGVFADNLKRSLITALLASSLTAENSDEEVTEQGYLAGSFYTLGYLLLAYYFPRLYELAASRPTTQQRGIIASINEMVGIDPTQLHLEILDALRIPTMYQQVVENAYRPLAQRSGDSSVLNLSHSVAAAGAIADTIVRGGAKSLLDQTLDTIESEGIFTRAQLDATIEAFPDAFYSHGKITGMSFLKLPPYLTRKKTDVPDSEADLQQAVIDAAFEQFSEYTEIIKQAISDEEPISSVITSAMEALVFALKYDRVILLLADINRSILQGKMVLGKEFDVDPREFKRRVNGARRGRFPDINAYLEGSPRITGDPVFPGCAPFAAIPVGLGDRAIGVIYADIRDKPENRNILPFNNSVKLALDTLAELLDQSLAQSRIQS